MKGKKEGAKKNEGRKESKERSRVGMNGGEWKRGRESKRDGGTR